MEARRFALTLDDGSTVLGSVQGSGGIIAGDSAIERLRAAIRLARDGQCTGFYQPQPGYCRLYPDYCADESGTPVDVDLRRVTAVVEIGVTERVIDATSAEAELTLAQRRLLATLRDGGPGTLTGYGLRAGRVLAAAGLITLEEKITIAGSRGRKFRTWYATARPVRVRKMVVMLDYTGLPRAWGCAPDLGSAIAIAETQLRAYVQKESTKYEPDLADVSKYTRQITDVREVLA